MQKEKYLQLFKYLKEFSELRSIPIRDIDKYEESLWLADIPQCPIFECITFSPYSQNENYWLKVYKPKSEPQMPIFPKLEEELSEWIVQESLIDEDGMPKLKDKILKEDIWLFLSDYPQIEKQFNEYLNDDWIKDITSYQKDLADYRIKHAEYEQQSKVYTKLFSISNKVEKFGEDYELILGVGLLYGKSNDNQEKMCRHLLTTKLEIVFDFDKSESFITVSPSIENKTEIETDFIMNLEQFDINSINSAEKWVNDFLTTKEIYGDLFHKAVKDAIQRFADYIDVDAKYELAKPNQMPNKTAIYFAPALILRKRNTKSFTALYEKIISQIDNGVDDLNISLINDVVGHPNQGKNHNQNNVFQNKDETIYFPKPYNSEQEEIVKKANNSNKILVQGPPGTGKSHTIANLICHLLAHGNSLLVTAHTKTALSVLKEKLPEEFQHLTVNLLSGDSVSKQELDKSVNAITAKFSQITDINTFKQDTEKQGTILSEIKRKKAYLENELLKIKEKEVRDFKVNNKYEGTLLKIAEQLENDKSDFEWFKDTFTDIQNMRWVAGVAEFISKVRYYEQINCEIFSYIVPSKAKILTTIELNRAKEIHQELKKYKPQSKNFTIECKDYTFLKEKLTTIYNILVEIKENRLPFKIEIINEYPHNQSIWKEKITQTKILLNKLTSEQLQSFDSNIELVYPQDKSWKILKSDAQIFLDYVKKGNALSGFSFKAQKITGTLPLAIKERLYFIETVKLNGVLCYTKANFETILADISIKEIIEELEQIWKHEAKNISQKYVQQAKFYKELASQTEAFLYKIEETHRHKKEIETISSVKIQDYEAENIANLISETNYNFLLFQEKKYLNRLNEVKNYLLSPEIHTIRHEILTAIENFDSEKYQQCLLEIDKLHEEKINYEQFLTQKATLTQYCPNLILEIEANTFNISHLPQLENAIYFKHAYSYIQELLAENAENELNNQLNNVAVKEQKQLAILASQKAWLNVLKKLNNNELLGRHLIAWSKAAGNIRAGRGIGALRAMRTAQEQMEKCKDAVPCWIMPLYKVAETITPQQGMYDYVIIDEASQVGADAMFLLYIAKNIIIVGDDKQTSPEYVGVESNVMAVQIQKFLSNIPFGKFFDLQYSFFDQADIFCNGRIVLQEHFRCMPEIIEFCNKHFYEPNGNRLYPLKQYAQNRLNPLESVYCQGGYVEGSGQNIKNIVEAEGIADKIVELISDENYFTIKNKKKIPKSIGVITLQGTTQAKLIENLILKKIGEVEYRKRDIKCGNSASFQGDERDIMFLSLVTAQNHRRTALTAKEYERRFNVAVSRAKEQVWLFHSVLPSDLKSDDLRKKLLDHFLDYRNMEKGANKTIPIPKQRKMGEQPSPFDSWFEVDVFNDIVRKGYSIIPQYEVARGKYRIDLVAILSNGIKIAIECDGDKYHGAEQFQNDMTRERVLKRCGWQFFRVRGSEYYSDREKSLEPLWLMFEENLTQKEEEISLNKQPQQETEEIVQEIMISPEPEIKNEVIEKTIQSKIEKKPTLAINKGQIDIFGNILDSSHKEYDIHKIKRTPEEDFFKLTDFWIFTSKFNAYKVVRNARFTNIATIIKEVQPHFENAENPIYITGTNDYSGYLIVAFENGKVAKINFSAFKTLHKKLSNAFNNDSKYVFIEYIEHDVDLVAIASNKKVSLFNTSEINAVNSRATQGVNAMKLKDNSKMVQLKKSPHVKFSEPEYYRKKLPAVGFYLKDDDIF